MKKQIRLLVSLAVFAILLLDLWYMFLIGTPDLVGIVIIIVSILFLMVQSHLLPQVARFDTKIKPVFKNAALLTVLHMPSSLMMAVLNVLPIPVFLDLYYLYTVHISICQRYRKKSLLGRYPLPLLKFRSWYHHLLFVHRGTSCSILFFLLV